MFNVIIKSLTNVDETYSEVSNISLEYKSTYQNPSHWFISVNGLYTKMQ